MHMNVSWCILQILKCRWNSLNDLIIQSFAWKHLLQSVRHLCTERLKNGRFDDPNFRFAFFLLSPLGFLMNFTIAGEEFRDSHGRVISHNLILQFDPSTIIKLSSLHIFPPNNNADTHQHRKYFRKSRVFLAYFGKNLGGLSFQIFFF